MRDTWPALVPGVQGVVVEFGRAHVPSKQRVDTGEAAASESWTCANSEGGGYKAVFFGVRVPSQRDCSTTPEESGRDHELCLSLCFGRRPAPSFSSSCWAVPSEGDGDLLETCSLIVENHRDAMMKPRQN